MPDIRFGGDAFARDAKLDAPEGFDHTARVLDYWSALRRNHGTIPARSALDPRDIAPSLSHVFIAELVTPRVARLRIAGGHLHDLMGMDVRGMPISVLLAPDARDEVTRALAHLAAGGRVQIPLSAERGLGRPAIDALLTLLPLRGTGEAIDRVLGVLDTLGPVGRAPRRFALRTATEATAPAPMRPLPAQPLFDAVRRITGQLAPRADAPTPPRAPAPKPARPRLRVIHGGLRD